jgi:hypothetical protein
MKLADKTYTKTALNTRIGNLNQLGGVRRVILDDGPAKGIQAFDIDTGAGLRFCVLPDRGMDISLTTYKGINLVFLTPNGEVNPAYYDAAGLGWLHTFFGGLLTTCGLTTLGAPGTDGDTDLGLHGRITAIPATQVRDSSRWEEDERVLDVTGTMRETRLFDHRLTMQRTIRTRIGARSLTIQDRITNDGFEPAPFAILYHVNAGFPLLDATSTLALTASKTEAHDEHSRNAMPQCREFTAPQPGFQEQNFLHLMGMGEDGKAHAAMLNPELAGGLGLALSFDPDELPYLNEWKMMAQGDYVVGIEPCNAPCANRGILRKHGLLPTLEPGETQTKTLTIDVLEGKEELQAFTEKYDNAAECEPFTTL